VRREPIIHYPEDNQPYIYGYEILAEKPFLIKTIEDDFNVFKLNFLLNEFNDGKVYHFNLQGRTILKFWKEIVEFLNKSSHREKVVIELSEGELSASKLSEVFNIFSKENIKVSLDDFDTASSNFDRFIEYRHIVESVKIDRILWKNMLGVVSEILKFGKNNNIKVICEKVESKEELEILIFIGVRYLQGWYFKDLEAKGQLPPNLLGGL
jgi:EAL domain-containing protein (putative c-di-GMP-specific phosphodiesterase class I)